MAAEVSRLTEHKQVVTVAAVTVLAHLPSVAQRILLVERTRVAVAAVLVLVKEQMVWLVALVSLSFANRREQDIRLL